MADVLQPSPYQAKALAASADLNQLHPGGRGGGCRAPPGRPTPYLAAAARAAPLAEVTRAVKS